MLKATEIEILSQTRQRLLAQRRGAKTQIVAEAASLLGCSVQTVYRKLEEVGFDSQRKRRSDAGECVLTDDQLRLVAGVLLASTNNKGQRMPVATALDMLRASGQLPVEVSESTVSRQLYQRRLHPEQLTLPTPSVQLRSLHPNHVWQVDSTTGAYYYMPGGRLRWMPEDEFYKNKVQNIVAASKDLLTRYAAADHASGAFKAKYYLGGETAANLLDFLAWAMWKQDTSPLHGVPFILMMDPGAANKSHVVRNFCKRLGTELIHHAPGAARVTGSVEKTHDLVRMHYETRLRFDDPAEVSIERLNASIEAWTAAFCTTRVHGRHGKSRFGAWMAIQPEQLRVAASIEALRDAAVKEPETRRVSNTKTISYSGSKGSNTYDLSLVPGIVAGLKCTVAENPFRAPAIDVLFVDPDTSEETWHVVEPMQTDQWGFREGAPVIGEQMRTAAYSQVDHSRNDLTREAYRTGDGLPSLEEAARARKAHAQAYDGLVDPMADVKATQVPAFLPRRSTPLGLPERQVEARRISVVDACKRLRDKLGAAYTPQVYAHVESTFPEGVPEDQLDALAALFTTGEPVADNKLRIVGGGAQ
jgi:hypothetical protein